MKVTRGTDDAAGKACYLRTIFPENRFTLFRIMR
jgi:hypothetical protein